MHHIQLINFEHIKESEASTYTFREAVRAIVFDANKKIALLHAKKDNYFKLPGGGIEKDEEKIEALKRECREELGCEIDIFCDLGIVTENRSKNKMKHISYCYMAHVIGEKGTPHMTESEIREGFHVIWIPITEAILKLESVTNTTYPGSYMVARDLAFLKIGSHIS
ncbi:MAG TPA: NUDIX domain-containing protein [Candidatus Paceibacterota bacterium]|nr:NUDIX domain-containing protein [Candidatus Paceibacterota bacterium]